MLKKWRIICYNLYQKLPDENNIKCWKYYLLLIALAFITYLGLTAFNFDVLPSKVFAMRFL